MVINIMTISADATETIAVAESIVVAVTESISVTAVRRVRRSITAQVSRPVVAEFIQGVGVKNLLHIWVVSGVVGVKRLKNRKKLVA